MLMSLSFLVGQTSTLDINQTKQGETVTATVSYVISVSATSTKILAAAVWAELGTEKLNFSLVKRIDSTDLVGNRIVTFHMAYKTTTANTIGKWTVKSKYQNQALTWKNSAGSKTFFLIKPDGSGYPNVGTVTPDPTPTPEPTPTPSAQGDWLSTKGNKIVKSDGTVWMGRGANLMDTRGCAACAGITTHSRVDEVKRRLDLLTSWGANFIRLTLESQLNSGYPNYRPVTQDAQYLAEIKEICDYAATKPGLYVEVSLWIDSSFSSSPVAGWPTAATIDAWKVLVTALKDNPRVMFGLVNEPQQNYSGTYDAQVWTAMNNAVQAIRDTEAQLGSKPHLIAVQGTGGWARFLKYYTTHPIAAGNGMNVIYEVHVYDPQTDFKGMFEDPSLIIPVIIGEFGPASGYMTMEDTKLLMDRAEFLRVPYLAWAFHMRCPPNLLIDNSSNGCGINMTLAPTPWGQQLKDQLSKPIQ
jgi:endoglucanase